jgi:hypothetical protein
VNGREVKKKFPKVRIEIDDARRKHSGWEKHLAGEGLFLGSMEAKSARRSLLAAENLT